MEINSAIYIANPFLDEPIVIKVTTPDGDLFVPIANDNSDYQAIQEWVAEGNTIAEAE